MSTDQNRIKQAGRLSLAANSEFLDSARELLVSFDRDAVSKAMLAYIRLNCRDEIAGNDPDFFLYLKIQQEAFLTLLDRGAVAPIAEITQLGQQALDAMRLATGIGLQGLPTPEPALSPEEVLEAQVREDWRKLPADKVRKKRANDRTYRETFDRIVDTLDSAMTEHVVIPGA